MPAIRPTREFAVEHLHSRRQSAVRDLQYDVVVIRHEAVAEDDPAMFARYDAEELEEDQPVEFVDVDRATVVAARADVIVGPRLFVAVIAWHRSTVARR